MHCLIQFRIIAIVKQTHTNSLGGNKMTNTIKAYVSTYEAYNNGSLIGVWIDLSDYNDADEFISAMKGKHGDNAELMFQNYESDFDLPRSVIGESHIDSLVWDLLSLADYDKDVVCALIDQGYTLKQALLNYQDVIVYNDWEELVDFWYETDEEILKRHLEYDGYIEHDEKIFLIH